MKLVEARYGKMYIIESDSVVSRALSLYGEWAEDEIDLLKDFIKQGACVLDIGAFIGTHTLAFSSLVGDEGRVFSFEPRKEIYDVLVKTVEINGYKNISALNCGISSRSGRISLPAMDIDSELNFGALPLNYDSSGQANGDYEIDVKSVDELKLSCKVDVVKIDVEGMEREVLDGASGAIERDRPIVLCECNSLSSGVDVLNFCELVGYLVYGYLSSAFNQNNYNSESENIFGQAKELSLLLVPVEKRGEVVQSKHCDRLSLIETPEDLVLPLLHKPQYPYEVLLNTSSAASMGINFPAPSNGPLTAEFDKKLSSLAKQVEELNETVLDRDKQILDLLNSRSWRLTKPLRSFRKLARLEWCADLVRLGRNVLISIRGEIRRNGFNGFIRRVPRYLLNYRMYISILMSRPSAMDAVEFLNKPHTLRALRMHPELSNDIGFIDKKISVVIPTLNAGIEFEYLIRKLRVQKGLPYLDIVIVDSGSTDETIAEAERHGCKIVEIPSREFTHSHARNVGAAAASGDYLLFMVQDAYPIGEYWLYGMVSYLLDHADEGLVAASCAEYSRSDSDMMYDSMINAHYKFLGCLEYDRIGEYNGEDHISLRSYGQLSDVSCLISKNIFDLYHYRGDYAEDLDLGIRLIKDGYKVAMLASVKVIHSHNRSSYYYLKRSFVDVYFLVGLFDDFVYPATVSPKGVVAGIASTAVHLSNWLRSFDNSKQDVILSEDISSIIKNWRSIFSDVHYSGQIALGDDRLDSYIEKILNLYVRDMDSLSDDDSSYEIRRFHEAFFARIEHFNVFVSGVYLEQDDYLRQGFCDAIIKIFASTAGSALSFMCLDISKSPERDQNMAVEISNELRAGV